MPELNNENMSVFDIKTETSEVQKGVLKLCIVQESKMWVDEWSEVSIIMWEYRDIKRIQ